MPNRTIDISYALDDDDTSPLGTLCGATVRLPEWTTTLSTSMGRVSASQGEALGEGHLPLLYLSPTRNPAVDLAGREARLIVELLRAQAFRDRGDKSLKELRGLLGSLIGSVTSKWPVADAEERVAVSLEELTVGVAGRVPYLGTTSVDDSFLARVFEFLLGVIGVPRSGSHRIDTEGLGYANLLQLAVVLSSIPDLTNSGDVDDASAEGGPVTHLDDDMAPHEQGLGTEDDRPEEVLAALMEEANERRELDDDSFFAGAFHAIVVLEEPEAHLHPQLQHGLVHYLKEVVQRRPEVQVILTTHSDEIIAAADPEDLVILRRDAASIPAARTIKSFNLSASRLAQARRHLDVTRSASLFAERSVLVEGITDAIVLRAIARVWAADSRIRRRFADALTISVVGSRVGRWLPELLCRPGEEIVERLAILRDTDGTAAPEWITQWQSTHFKVFFSDPTLEPSLTAGNEDMVREILVAMNVAGSGPQADDSELPGWVAEWVKRKGKARKARFADSFAARCRSDPLAVAVPSHLGQLLDFVWDGFYTKDEADGKSANPEEISGE
ncbi:MAG: ATP-dependent nuclease [Pseudonocardiaceae bacterium]